MARVGTDVVVVNPGRPLALRVEKPDQNRQLQHIVEWDKVQDETGKLVDHIEETKYDPVGKPLLIIALIVGLECTERHKDWVSDTDKGSKDGLADAEHHKEHEAD